MIAGDDPDVTNGSEIITKVELFEEEGDISFFGGDGVGTITQEGLKIPPGQPAINPVPRQMAEKAIRRIIGNKKANITVSIPRIERPFTMPSRGLNVFLASSSPPGILTVIFAFLLPMILRIAFSAI